MANAEAKNPPTHIIINSFSMQIQNKKSFKSRTINNSRNMPYDQIFIFLEHSPKPDDFEEHVFAFFIFHLTVVESVSLQAGKPNIA